MDTKRTHELLSNKIIHCFVNVYETDLNTGFSDDFYFNDYKEMYDFLHRWYQELYPNGEDKTRLCSIRYELENRKEA